MATRIQIRRDTAENWNTLDPILLPGEIGIEIDTLKMKIGPATPGGTQWSSILTYANIVPEDLNDTLEDYILFSERGAAGGVVALNNSANAVVPGSSIIIEGSDLDNYETTLTIEEPTADRTLTIPNETGVLATRAYVDNAANNAVASVLDSAPEALNTLNELAAALGDDANFATTVTNSLSTKQDKVTGISDVEISYLDGATSNIQNQLNSKLPLSGGTMTGNIILSGDPTQPLHPATKQYVDNTAAGLNFHAAVHAATIANLNATYNNGTSGVGATLTGNSNGGLDVDGHNISVGDRVLVKDQTSAFQNGIYLLTTKGDPTSPFVLTRATDADNSPNGEVAYGDFVFVQNGTNNAGYGYILNTSGTITLGTTALSYVEFNAGKTVAAGNGLVESTPGIFEIDSFVTTAANTQTLVNKTINSANNTITVTSANVSDFNEAAQDAVGNSVGTGLLYNDTSGAISVDETYIQTRVNGVTNTEIGYLNGVTSAIQDQINLKANAENTVLTGNANAENLTLSGNLIVNGTNTILNTDTLQIEDNEILLNSNVTGSPTLNAFLKVKRGVESDVYVKWNELSNVWEVSNDGTSSGVIATTQDLINSVNSHNSDTLNVHGIADTSLLATQSDLGSHNSSTTNVHGIADTSVLVTDEDLGNHNLDTTNVHGIADTSVLVTQTDLSTHNSDTTNVHGIADTSVLVTQTDLSNHNSDTTNVHGISDTSVLATQSDISNHNADTTNVHGILDTSELATQTDISAHNSGTTNVHGIPDTSLLATQSDISTHNSDTTNVHGIPDTSVLATNSYVTGLIEAHEADTTNVHGIADTSVLATNSSVTNAVDTHNNDTTNVHGIADTSILVTTTGTQTLTNKTLTSPAISSPTGIVKSDVGLGNVDNTSDLNKVISTATQIALDLKAPIESPTFTGTVSGITKSMVGLGNVDNTSDANKPVSTATQSALDLKAPIESPTFTGTVSGVTKSMVGLSNVDNTSDTNKPISTATQSALDLKAPLESPTFTGTVSGINKSMVGLANVDNTSDTNKPISTATQAALDAKASLSGAIFTGSVEIDQNLTVDGNLTVNGTTFNASSTSIVIEDNMLQLAHQNAANTVDLGLVVGYNDGAAKHSGIVRDVSADRWKIFKGVTTEPTTTVDFTQGSLDDLEVFGIIASSATIGSVTNTEIGYLSGVTSAIQAQINSKAPLNSPTFTGTVSGITKSMVGLNDVDNTSDANKPVSTATQSALDLKAPLASPTFTGTVSGITKSMVGLGNVDNTSDANKPISTATQSALDLKAPIASPTFTGTVTVANNGIAFTDGTQTKQGVVSLTPIVYKTANYTIGSGNDLTLRDNLIEVNSTSAVTITLPNDSTANYPIGTSIDILQTNTGQVTIAGEGFTPDATPGLKLRTRWSSCTVFKRASNTWVVYGDLTA